MMPAVSGRKQIPPGGGICFFFSLFFFFVFVSDSLDCPKNC